MSTALLLYLIYSGFALLMCLWAFGSALPRSEDHDVGHRWLLLMSSVVLPLCVLSATAGFLVGRPETAAALLVAPLLVLSAITANTITLHRQGFFRRLLHVPIAAWNGTLAIIFLLRGGLDVAGIDVVPETLAILNAHAHLQTHVGSIDATSWPLLMHLPILLPLASSRGSAANDLALFAWSSTSACLLALLALHMPFALKQVESYCSDTLSVDRALPELRSDLHVGVGLELVTENRLGPSLDDDIALEARIHALGQLRPDTVFVSVRPEDVIREGLALERLVALKDRCTRNDQRLVVSVRPSERFFRVPARDLAEFGGSVAEAHWAVAESIKPDVLVLYTGPYQELSTIIATPVSISEWVDRFAQDAKQVCSRAPDTRTAIAISSRARHAEDLYRRLVAKTSPVDLIALSLRLEESTFEDLERRLTTWRDWAQRIPGDRRLLALCPRSVPVLVGGETGQWIAIRRLLLFGQRTPRVDTIICGTLSAEPGGLLGPFGRRRIAFSRIGSALTQRPVSETSPKPD